MIRKICFTFLICFSIQAGAQEKYSLVKDYSTWFVLENKLKLNDKFYLMNEMHLRTVNFMSELQLFRERPSIHYAQNDVMSYGLGVTYDEVRPKGNHTLVNPVTNFEIFPEIQIAQVKGKSPLTHRFRWELRFKGNVGINPNKSEDKYSVFGQRFRYRMQRQFELDGIGLKHFLYKSYIEPRINFNNGGLRTPEFDQINLFNGLGYQFNKDGNIFIAWRYDYHKLKTLEYYANSILWINLNYNFSL